MVLKSDTTVSTTDNNSRDAFFDDESACREYELATPLVVEGEAIYTDQPVHLVSHTLDVNKFAALSNLRNNKRTPLTWDDDYFDEDIVEDSNDIIAVFDFDYEKMETFYTSMGWAAFASTLIYTPLFVLGVMGGTPCYLRQNVQWFTRCQHVAITQDGIRFVRERRPSCWGLSCTDRGKSSKTVPFDKITDCDIEEPAGNSCLCVPNILCTVNIDTASSGGGSEGTKHELRLAGLKDPHSFKKLVWAMKRSQQQQRHAGPVAHTVTNRGGRNSSNDNANGEELAVLLREIRDELRTNNQMILQTTNQTI